MLCSLQKRFHLEENTEDEKIQVVWAPPYQIQYKNTTELHGGYILIPWCELTEQSKVAESARCSSFFSFFPDRGPCNECLY